MSLWICPKCGTFYGHIIVCPKCNEKLEIVIYPKLNNHE